MTFQDLMRFIAVVEAGSINAAASALRISQPALSVQLAQMEAGLNAQLLIRTSRGIVPTDAGNALYRQAQLIMRSVGEIPELISTSVLEPGGRVNVGFSASLAAAFGVPFIQQVREKYPKILLQIFEAPATIQKEMAANNRIDFALVLAEPEPPDMMLTPVYRQSLFAVVPAERRGKSISFDELLSSPLALPSKENPIRIVFDQESASRGMKPQSVVECRSMTNLLQVVRADLGFAVLPWIPLPMFGEKRPLFRFLEITDVSLELLVCICEAPARSTSAALLAKNALQDVIFSTIRRPSWHGAVT
jgi:LysR family nitrogen assimilation transcriptional regulator